MDLFYEIYNNITDTNVAVGADIQWVKMEDLPTGQILLGNLANKAEPADPTAIAGSLDHNSLLNLPVGDVHTQYSLVDGTRAFTGKVAGVSTVGGDPATTLATKDYIDGSVITAHSALSGLVAPADDHTQYSLVDGTRAYTGKVAGVSTAGGDPAATLTTKDYVDAAIAAGVAAGLAPYVSGVAKAWIVVFNNAVTNSFNIDLGTTVFVPDGGINPYWDIFFTTPFTSVSYVISGNCTDKPAIGRTNPVFVAGNQLTGSNTQVQLWDHTGANVTGAGNVGEDFTIAFFGDQ